MLQIYLMKIDDFLENNKFLQGCSLVDGVRLQKIQSCKQTEDKVRSLCCGLLLQYAMKKQIGGKLPLDLKYENGEHGKPYFADYPQLHFNLSHSGEYAVLVFANQEAGIDIQQKRPIREALVKRVLSSQEYEKYAALDGNELSKEDYFFGCWCAKESYGKLTGNGILQGMETIVYDVENKRISDTMSGSNIFCKEYILKNGYYLNVCTKVEAVFPESITELSFSHMIE